MTIPLGEGKSGTIEQSSPTDLIRALEVAERFIAGFEDDTTQEGIRETLATIRNAIGQTRLAIVLPIEWDTPLRDVSDCAQHPKSKLLGTLLIAGVAHHIEAWEVHDMPQCNLHGEAQFPAQEAVCPESCNYDEIVDHMTEGAGATVEIEGRQYFICVTPFQE